ncbi:MAG: FkbM family methyltransferase [Candidatus Cloacimonetes bacterium]|nr:FkbM family methyltransferase [Candidatus Cloacimonadota bacterium]
MMQRIHKFISKYPRLADPPVRLKLYIKFPHRLITDIKVFIRKTKAKKLGIVFFRPNFIYFDKFHSSSIIIDVGCGFEADLSRHLISKYGLTSYGVDPTLKHAKFLRELEKETEYKFKYLPLALTKTNGRIIFHETLEHESGSIFSSHKNILVDKIRTYEVESVSLKGLIKKIGVETVDYIKLDLEGAEYELLVNVSQDELKAFKQIFIEFHHHAIKPYSINNTRKIVKYMYIKGFRSYSLDDSNYLFLNMNI